MPDGLMAVRVVPLPTDAAGPQPFARDQSNQNGTIKWERSCDQ